MKWSEMKLNLIIIFTFFFVYVQNDIIKAPKQMKIKTEKKKKWNEEKKNSFQVFSKCHFIFLLSFHYLFVLFIFFFRSLNSLSEYNFHFPVQNSWPFHIILQHSTRIKSKTKVKWEAFIVCCICHLNGVHYLLYMFNRSTVFGSFFFMFYCPVDWFMHNIYGMLDIFHRGKRST